MSLIASGHQNLLVRLISALSVMCNSPNTNNVLFISSLITSCRVFHVLETISEGLKSAKKKMKVFVILVVLASLSCLVSSAAVRPRTGGETKQNQYPWYYWNQDGQQGQQGQYPYYMQRCGAQGIGSLNLVSLVVVGMAALAFAGLPQESRS